MNILVTGGAGYIGSVTVKRLLEAGHNVVVFDNLVYGHKESVTCPLIIGNLEDKKFLFDSLDSYKFDGVIHFAAYALAGESMQNPYKYFYSNMVGGLNILEYMREKDIKNIIFSSTCAIYGTPEKIPVTEKESKKPESVYGESKLAFENILAWYEKIYGIKHVCLRYFNAAGASIDGTLGESHTPETHIIPIAIQVALGKRYAFELYGQDYETKDGTCIRDYIHVEDLAVAHIKALELVQTTEKSNYFNLGTGNGYSNREVLSMVQKVTKINFSIIECPRRIGDPARIYADNTKAKEVLGWYPEYSDLEMVVKTAWEWHRKQQ